MTEFIAIPAIVALGFTVYFALKLVGQKIVEGAKKISTPSTETLLKILIVIAIIWLALQTFALYRWEF